MIKYMRTFWQCSSGGWPCEDSPVCTHHSDVCALCSAMKDTQHDRKVARVGHSFNICRVSYVSDKLRKYSCSSIHPTTLDSYSAIKLQYYFILISNYLVNFAWRNVYFPVWAALVGKSSVPILWMWRVSCALLLILLLHLDGGFEHLCNYKLFKEVSSSWNEWVSERARDLVVRFEVLGAVTLKNIVLWEVTPCSLVNRYQSAGETYLLHFLGAGIHRRCCRFGSRSPQ
jgi:hypothetical protein